MTDVVVAAHAWASNAELIVDVARLGYLDGTVLDATHGRGVFWKKWRPEHLTTSDLRSPADHAWDYKHLPLEDATFDVVVFDPDYRYQPRRMTTHRERQRAGARTIPRSVASACPPPSRILDPCSTTVVASVPRAPTVPQRAPAHGNRGPVSVPRAPLSKGHGHALDPAPRTRAIERMKKGTVPPSEQGSSRGTPEGGVPPRGHPPVGPMRAACRFMYGFQPRVAS